MFLPLQLLELFGYLSHCTSRIARQTLNRLRVGVGRCEVDMVRWGYGGDEKCGCGELHTIKEPLPGLRTESGSVRST